MIGLHEEVGAETEPRQNGSVDVVFHVPDRYRKTTKDLAVAGRSGVVQNIFWNIVFAHFVCLGAVHWNGIYLRIEQSQQ